MQEVCHVCYRTNFFFKPNSKNLPPNSTHTCTPHPVRPSVRPPARLRVTPHAYAQGHPSRLRADRSRESARCKRPRGHAREADSHENFFRKFVRKPLNTTHLHPIYLLWVIRTTRAPSAPAPYARTGHRAHAHSARPRGSALLGYLNRKDAPLPRTSETFEGATMRSPFGLC